MGRVIQTNPNRIVQKFYTPNIVYDFQKEITGMLAEFLIADCGIHVKDIYDSLAESSMVHVGGMEYYAIDACNGDGKPLYKIYVSLMSEYNHIGNNVNMIIHDMLDVDLTFKLISNLNTFIHKLKHVDSVNIIPFYTEGGRSATIKINLTGFDSNLTRLAHLLTALMFAVSPYRVVDYNDTEDGFWLLFKIAGLGPINRFMELSCCVIEGNKSKSNLSIVVGLF